MRSLKTESKAGKKEASIGGDVSEYIRANTATRKRRCTTITSVIMIPRQEDTSPLIRLDWKEG